MHQINTKVQMNVARHAVTACRGVAWPSTNQFDFNPRQLLPLFVCRNDHRRTRLRQRDAGPVTQRQPKHLSSPAPRLHRLRQHLQRLQRMLPAQARIGDAFAIFQLGSIVLPRREFLRAGVQVALHHHAKNAF